MKDEKKYLDMLARRDIPPTAIRLLVLDAMMQAKQSVSLADLDNMLDTVDNLPYIDSFSGTSSNSQH